MSLEKFISEKLKMGRDFIHFSSFLEIIIIIQLKRFAVIKLCLNCGNVAKMEAPFFLEKGK